MLFDIPAHVLVAFFEQSINAAAMHERLIQLMMFLDVLKEA